MTLPEVKNLSGGAKQHWNRVNRDFIIQYCDLFGPEKTCQEFKLMRETLEKIYKTVKKPVPLDKAEKAMMLAQIARQAANECRSELRDLKQDFSRFEEVVAGKISRRIAGALAESLIREFEDSPGPELPECLDVNNENGDFSFK